MKDYNQMDSQGFILTSQMTGPLFLLGPTDTVVSSIRNSESRLIANCMDTVLKMGLAGDNLPWEVAVGLFPPMPPLEQKASNICSCFYFSKIAIHWCSVG